MLFFSLGLFFIVSRYKYTFVNAIIRYRQSTVSSIYILCRNKSTNKQNLKQLFSANDIWAWTISHLNRSTTKKCLTLRALVECHILYIYCSGSTNPRDECGIVARQVLLAVTLHHHIYHCLSPRQRHFLPLMSQSAAVWLGKYNASWRSRDCQRSAWFLTRPSSLYQLDA